MREQIQAYVNGLFADAALTIRNAEVRQEILQHTLDRYDDLVASGKPEQEAYDEAIAGIGDVSELYEHKPAEKQAEAPKSARDFPAPPAAPYMAPAAPAKKKKFPGWAIALICAAVVLLAVNLLERRQKQGASAIFMTTRGPMRPSAAAASAASRSWRTSTRSRSTGCPAVSISSSRRPTA